MNAIFQIVFRLKSFLFAGALLSFLLAANPLLEASPVEDFYTRVGPQSPKLYQNVHATEGWKNPFLVINAEGIKLNQSPRMIQPKDLVFTLLALPTGSWPYGRVVALSSNPIQDANSAELIQKNWTEAKKELVSIQMKIVLWPSN